MEGMKPNDVKGGALYRHFKGDLYRVCEFATNTETGETIFTYKNVHSGTIWVGPIEMFCEMVDDKPRFEEVEE